MNDYILMPRELTAENGARYALTGEFKVSSDHPCPECYKNENEEGDDDCEICNGTNFYTSETYVDWTTIKAIYNKAVKVCAADSATQKRIDDIERQIIASYDERTAMRTTGIIAGVVLSVIVLVSVFMMIAS